MTSPLWEPEDDTDLDDGMAWGVYPAVHPKEVSRAALQAKEDGKRIWEAVQAYIRGTNAR
jgi:hypothetical protein